MFAALVARFADAVDTVEAGHRDFAQVWYAARVILQHGNPYTAIGPGRAFEWAAPLFYPLPAALVALPLAPLPEHPAMVLVAAMGGFLLSWALTQYGVAPLLAFASTCVWQAFELVQWSPILAGALVIAPLSAILITKPTIGAAVFFARPSWYAVGGGAFLMIISLGIQPHWIAEWRGALASAGIGEGNFPYVAPVMVRGGVLVLAAATRWRRQEARLLIALACVPQTLIPYEGVLLFLIPRGWLEAGVLVLLSYVMSWWAWRGGPYGSFALGLQANWVPMVVCLYLPATLMVLRRPNEGLLPPWVEQRIRAWPAWLRGIPAA